MAPFCALAVIQGVVKIVPSSCCFVRGTEEGPFGPWEGRAVRWCSPELCEAAFVPPR